MQNLGISHFWFDSQIQLWNLNMEFSLIFENAWVELMSVGVSLSKSANVLIFFMLVILIYKINLFDFEPRQ